MAMYRYEYEVQGRVDFPLDMLRYDCSFPYGSEDVSFIEETRPNHGFGAKDHRTVTVRLVRYADNKHWEPTFGRWQSFLWSVKYDSLKVQKVA